MDTVPINSIKEVEKVGVRVILDVVYKFIEWDGLDSLGRVMYNNELNEFTRKILQDVWYRETAF